MKYIVYVFIVFMMVGCKGESGEIKEVEETAEYDKGGLATIDQWKGIYFVEAFNRDDAKTRYDIVINSLDDIMIHINEDGSKESYSHVKGEIVETDKIKVVYNNSSDQDMGVVYLEKRDKEYFISGNSIYFINPGTVEIIITKLK